MSKKVLLDFLITDFRGSFTISNKVVNENIYKPQATKNMSSINLHKNYTEKLPKF